MSKNRAPGQFLRLSLLLVVCVTFAPFRGFAQVPDETQTSNPSNPSTPSQSPQTQTDDEETDQGANQQKNQPAPDADQSVQMEPSLAEPPEAAQSEGTMSAAQIVSILQAEPDALESVKSLVAQQTGADPTTITDKSLFARIRESEQTRILATKELVARGYSVNSESPEAPGLNGQPSGPSSKSGRATTPARTEGNCSL